MECVVSERFGQFCDAEAVSAEIKKTVSNNDIDDERRIKHLS